MSLNTRMDWVVGYPKSGTTWLRLMLKAYYRGELLDQGDTGLYWYQGVCPRPADRLTPAQEIQIRGAAMFNIASAANNSPTLIKSHNANIKLDGVPLFARAWVNRLIYMVRDPRDVAVSMAAHTNKPHAEVVDLMANPEAALRDVQMSDRMRIYHFLNTWSDHVRSWQQADDFPVMFLSYEDLWRNPVAELTAAVEFLGWEVEPDRIEQVVSDHEFAKLQAKERKEGFKEASEFGPFFRRGIVGAWKDELTPELAERIEREHGTVMANLGYSERLVPV